MCSRYLFFFGFTFAIIGISTFLQVNDGTGRQAKQPSQVFPLNQLAPEFTVVDPEGKRIALAGYRGQILLLDFWATWCPPCREEVPALIELQERYGKRRFTILGISFDESDAAVRKFHEEKKLNYPVARVSPSFDKNYGALFQFPDSRLIGSDGLIRSTLPTTILIDGEGKLHSVHVGSSEFPMMQKEIKELMEGAK